jgi:hypothetical protein
MFALALFPPLWRAVMNPRVLNWRLEYGLTLDARNPHSHKTTLAMSDSPFQRQQQDWLHTEVAELCKARTAGEITEAEFIEILRQREKVARQKMAWPVAALLILCGVGVLLFCGGCGLAPFLLN